MADEIIFHCDLGSCYACDYGTRYLGCCVDFDGDRVFRQGCEVLDQYPAYFESSFFDNRTSAPLKSYDDDYVWLVFQHIM